jgi:hypothetical protein
MLVAVFGISTLPHAWADDNFIVYSQNNILTIFKLQTEDMPFLAGGAKFLITPNPFSHTAITNNTAYNADLGGYALIIADNDPLLDADPTDGIIELVGVQPGAYSVIELAGPAGFITNDTPGFAEIEDGKIATAFSSVHFFSVPINFDSIQNVVVHPPAIDNSAMSKLQMFGAKVGGVNLNSDNLPDAIISSSPFNAKPKAVVFDNAVNGQQNASTLFDSLGIPTYKVPSPTSGAGGFFMPPPFITSDSSGGKLVFTPKLENVHSGLKLAMNLRDQDLGSTKFALDELNIPIGIEGQDIGFKIKVQDTIPAGMPASPQGEAALFLSVDTTGSIDFGNSASFASSPTVEFKVKKNLATGVPALGDGCPDVRMYLRNPSTNTWEILAQPARNPAGDTADMCSYIQTLPHFSDYVVSGNNGTVPIGGGGGGHGGHGGSSGGSSGSSHSGHGSSTGPTAPTLQPDLIAGAWKRVQIDSISFAGLQGGIVIAPNVGQQILISAQITNTMNKHQPYAFIVQVLDENRFTTSITWIEGHLDHGQTIKQSRSWTPDHMGKYHIDVMVWDGISQVPAPLAEKAEAELQVQS